MNAVLAPSFYSANRHPVYHDIFVVVRTLAGEPQYVGAHGGSVTDPDEARQYETAEVARHVAGMLNRVL